MNKKKPCVHYYLVQMARGPESEGVCKFCHDKKVFINTPPEDYYNNKVNIPTDRQREKILKLQI